ncbi:MAG: hypothetical protein KBT06_04515 [Prevotellaceae bacterium]|nr:hypothetical protein [Candidatus Colivivens equi]
MATRIGFGQVEPNHLSAQITGQNWAQLPAAADIDILENGQFVKYDYVSKEVNFGSDEHKTGEWMMVWNEIKLYGEKYGEGYKDFAQQRKNFTPATYKDPVTGADTVVQHGAPQFPVWDDRFGQMVPRVIKINLGDIFTTNTLTTGNTSGSASVTIEDLNVGDSLKVGANGFLTKGNDPDFELQVVHVYTMADGQYAVKVMRIK